MGIERQGHHVAAVKHGQMHNNRLVRVGRHARLGYSQSVDLHLCGVAGDNFVGGGAIGFPVDHVALVEKPVEAAGNDPAAANGQGEINLGGTGLGQQSADAIMRG